MVITVPASRPSGSLRQINPKNDISQIIQLLRLVFGDEFEDSGQKIFNAQGRQSNPNFLWRLDPLMSKLAPGFVWDVDGHIVGNVTIIHTKSKRRCLVANVAVHPDYRRKGIARKLMDAAIRDVSWHGAKEVALQVVHDNKAAVGLYKSMNFLVLGSMTTWQSSVSRLRTFGGETSSRLLIEPLPANSWREAYELDRKALHRELHWPEPLTIETYRKNFGRRVSDFLNGRRFDAWVSFDNENRFSGLASLYSEWGRTHQLSIRVNPAWRGQLERALLGSMVLKAKKLSRRNIQMIHSADDELMNQLLPNVNFSRQRTLTYMRLKIESDSV